MARALMGDRLTALQARQQRQLCFDLDDHPSISRHATIMFTPFWQIITCDCPIPNTLPYDSDRLGEKNDTEGSKIYRKLVLFE
jgi:hypothetical protein